jgi:hypothetical protein
VLLSSSLRCSSGGTGRRAGLKIRFEALAANRTKTHHSEIACIWKGFRYSHYALPRNETHRIANPTDTNTDTSEPVEDPDCRRIPVSPPSPPGGNHVAWGLLFTSTGTLREHPPRAVLAASRDATSDEKNYECPMTGKVWSHRFRPAQKDPSVSPRKISGWENNFSLAVSGVARQSQMRLRQPGSDLRANRACGSQFPVRKRTRACGSLATLSGRNLRATKRLSLMSSAL